MNRVVRPSSTAAAPGPLRPRRGPGTFLRPGSPRCIRTRPRSRSPPVRIAPRSSPIGTAGPGDTGRHAPDRRDPPRSSTPTPGSRPTPCHAPALRPMRRAYPGPVRRGPPARSRPPPEIRPSFAAPGRGQKTTARGHPRAASRTDILGSRSGGGLPAAAPPVAEACQGGEPGPEQRRGRGVPRPSDGPEPAGTRSSHSAGAEPVGPGQCLAVMSGTRADGSDRTVADGRPPGRPLSGRGQATEWLPISISGVRAPPLGGEGRPLGLGTGPRGHPSGRA